MEEEKQEKTITVKKSDLWKYSTFLLIAVLVIGGFFMFTGKGNATGNTVNNPSGGNTGNTAAADVSAFLNNPSLYPSLGPSDSKTTVIEFSDFQCPFCGMASGLPSWVGQAAGQYGDLIGAAGKVEQMAQQGKLKFVYVSMSFLGQESVYAAEAGLCANEQKKFWEMHDAIFTAQTQGENNGKYNKDKLEIIANGISGIDASKFKDCLDKDKYLSAVQQAGAQASTAAQGTPMFYVDGKQVRSSWTAIQAAIGA